MAHADLRYGTFNSSIGDRITVLSAQVPDSRASDLCDTQMLLLVNLTSSRYDTIRLKLKYSAQREPCLWTLHVGDSMSNSGTGMYHASLSVIEGWSMLTKDPVLSTRLCGHVPDASALCLRTEAS